MGKRGFALGGRFGEERGWFDLLFGERGDRIGPPFEGPANLDDLALEATLTKRP